MNVLQASKIWLDYHRAHSKKKETVLQYFCLSRFRWSGINNLLQLRHLFCFIIPIHIGKYCFQLDNFPIERFVWEVEQVGDAYQLTGRCPYWNSGMSGGGATNGSNVVNFVMTEADPDGWRRIFSIAINLSSLTGTADFQWFDDSGDISGVYNDEPISNVPCSAALDVEGPNSRW